MNTMLKVMLCLTLGYNVCALSALGQEKSQASCEAIELFGKVNNKYNRSVCDGISAMQSKRYKEAVKMFEAAMQETLYESPNFVLYPRLALAYMKSGDLGKAKETLRKGELSLLIFIGAAKCVETEEDRNIIRRYGSDRDRSVYESPYWSEVARRMCGAAYDVIYTQRSFESVLGDAKLVKAYLDIKKEIEAP